MGTRPHSRRRCVVLIVAVAVVVAFCRCGVIVAHCRSLSSLCILKLVVAVLVAAHRRLSSLVYSYLLAPVAGLRLVVRALLGRAYFVLLVLARW